MALILKQHYEPHIAQLGFFRKTEDGVKSGFSYELDSKLGRGTYWVLPVSDFCAISIYNIELSTDLELSFSQPPFLYVGLCQGISAKPTYDLHEGLWSPKGVMGYVGEGEKFDLKLSKRLKIRSVGVSFTSGYCDEKPFLPTSFDEFTGAIRRLDKSVVHPELLTTLHQMRSFTPTRALAPLYYEGKIKELLSYLLHWDRVFQSTDESPLSREDETHLRAVTDHLHDNYANPAPLRELASMACMSPNKLTALFKKTYGITMREFLQNIRVERAKPMLRDSGWKIEAVANDIGYKHHGSFSEVFKRVTGVTPRQYRNANRKPPGASSDDS